MEAGSDGLSAGAISKKLHVPPNNLSSHLNILANAGLISAERNGRSMIYRAEIDNVSALLSSLVETCCHGHPEVCGAVALVQNLEFETD